MCGSLEDPFIRRLLDKHLEKISIVRCVPALGLHQNCEHVKPCPSFPRNS